MRVYSAQIRKTSKALRFLWAFPDLGSWLDFCYKTSTGKGWERLSAAHFPMPCA